MLPSPPGPALPALVVLGHLVTLVVFWRLRKHKGQGKRDECCRVIEIVVFVNVKKWNERSMTPPNVNFGASTRLAVLIMKDIFCIFITVVMPMFIIFDTIIDAGHVTLP